VDEPMKTAGLDIRSLLAAKLGLQRNYL
jgi:hypothetical protein